VEADLGLVRYLAAPLGTSDENVMRWFILAARASRASTARPSAGCRRGAAPLPRCGLLTRPLRRGQPVAQAGIGRPGSAAWTKKKLDHSGFV
jgi:hypothetical protein